MTIVFGLDSLTPANDYEIYIYFMSMNRIYNKNFTLIWFQTNSNFSNFILNFRLKKLLNLNNFNIILI
jgi:hypothetical protein